MRRSRLVAIALTPALVALLVSYSAGAVRRPSPSPSPSPSPGANFVLRSGAGFTLNGKPWFGYGFNIYNANSRDNCWYSLGAANGSLDAMLGSLPSGIEVIRSWYFSGLAGTPSNRDWSAFDQTLATLDRYGMKAWFVISNEWGGCGDYPASGRKTAAWFLSGYTQPEANGQSYRSYLIEVLTRYGSDPRIAAFELMNEPEAPQDAAGSTCDEAAGSAALQHWVDDVAPLAKTLTTHLVTVGTIGGGQCGTAGGNFTLFYDQAALDACDIHDYYEPGHVIWPGDQWNGEALRREQCASLGKPFIASELGIRGSVAGTASTRANWLKTKLTAWKQAGVDVVMPWNLCAPHDVIYGACSLQGYDFLVPDDPAIRVVARL